MISDYHVLDELIVKSVYFGCYTKIFNPTIYLVGMRSIRCQVQHILNYNRSKILIRSVLYFRFHGYGVGCEFYNIVIREK